MVTATSEFLPYKIPEMVPSPVKRRKSSNRPPIDNEGAGAPKVPARLDFSLHFGAGRSGMSTSASRFVLCSTPFLLLADFALLLAYAPYLLLTC
jgi:hypothetical protein